MVFPYSLKKLSQRPKPKYLQNAGMFVSQAELQSTEVSLKVLIGCRCVLNYCLILWRETRKIYSPENSEANGNKVLQNTWAVSALQALESSQKGGKHTFPCMAPMNCMKSIAKNPQYLGIISYWFPKWSHISQTAPQTHQGSACKGYMESGENQHWLSIKARVDWRWDWHFQKT